MEKLWQIAGRDLQDDPSEDERVGYIGNVERMEEDEEEEEEEEEEEDWGDDADRHKSGRGAEVEQPRPMKRHRSKERTSSGRSSGGPSTRQGDSEDDDQEDDDDEQEVIEIFSDDEDGRSSLGRRSRGHGPIVFPALPPSATSTGAGAVSAGGEASRPSTTMAVASAGDRFFGAGAPLPPRSPFDPESKSGGSRQLILSDSMGHSRREPSGRPVRNPSLLPGSRSADWRVVPLSVRCDRPPACGEEGEDGKPSAEERPTAGNTWGEFRGSEEAASEARLLCGHGCSGLSGLKGTSTVSVGKAAPDAATAAGTVSEFPLNLECPMCFHPLAVVALFACGHGACWECAHDWCGRGTTATMDCPACHVCIPRNDFRRCVVLDEVVEKAVIAAGLDMTEWQNRLQRGQDLARRFEADRRSAREAQQSADQTIAKQAAELERLREELKSRATGRGRRFHDGFSPAMTDLGLRLVSRGDLLDAAPHRAADSVPRGAAPSVSVLPSEYPGVGLRPRVSSSSGSSSLGLTAENPWFSLRSSSSTRHPGVSMSAMRVGREAYGRGAASSSPIVPRIDPTAGAVLKSEHERRYPVGQDQAHFARNGPVDNDAALPGARVRSSALSSLYALSGLQPGARVSFSGTDVRGSAVAAAAAVPVGRRLSSQPPPARPSRKRYGTRAPSPAPSSAVSATPVTAAASLSASYLPAAAAAAGSPPPSVGGAPHERFGVGLPGNGGVASRFETAESDFEALDMISNHDDFSGRPTEWDDVLAAVSLRHPESDESHPGARG